MEIKLKKNFIYVRNIKQFNVEEILECGQVFRFEKVDFLYYFVVAHERILYIKHEGEGEVRFWYGGGRQISLEEFQDIWVKYFDLGRDYAEIQRKISDGDDIMAQAVNFAPGIRILKQDPWEMLISFIISQNNRIPQIKNVIKNICEKYGDPLGEGHFAFPTVQQLAAATREDFRELKAGFRDKYLVDAIEWATKSPQNGDLKQQLLSIKGVGEKVADCILLFGYAHHHSFPVDVWVRRVMEQLYFSGEKTSLKEIQNYASQRFGGLAGFAQQYLFHYMRNNALHNT